MTGEICIANIGPRERSKRLRLGLVMAVAAVAWLGVSLVLDLPRAARLLVFLPAWMAGLGIFQHREKT